MLRSADALRERASGLREMLSPCRLCPNACGVDRLAGEIGRCGVGRSPRVASYGPHFGEEAPLVGDRGSGAVFFAGCNLACVYCQNWTISQGREGRDLTEESLAELFLRLQGSGCTNLNLVSPTHQAHAVVGALAVAVGEGFRLPIVWNSGGYDAVDALRLLEGIVDVYMPDVKYGTNGAAERLSGVSDYVEVSQHALAEMHRQVGSLAIGADGVARRGVLVRHLVLPGGMAGTVEVMEFLGTAISSDTFVNVMDQYRPCHRAGEFIGLGRPITGEEHAAALRAAADAGLHRLAREGSAW